MAGDWRIRPAAARESASQHSRLYLARLSALGWLTGHKAKEHDNEHDETRGGSRRNGGEGWHGFDRRTNEGYSLKNGLWSLWRVQDVAGRTGRTQPPHGGEYQHTSSFL